MLHMYWNVHVVDVHQGNYTNILFNFLDILLVMWSLNDFINMLLNIVLRCSTSNPSRVEYFFTNCCGNKFLYEVWNDTYSGTCTLCSDHELHTQIIQQMYSVAGYEFYQTFRSVSMKVQMIQNVFCASVVGFFLHEI